MALARLVALIEFASFGKSYSVGDTIELADAADWPGESLSNRLKNGYVKYAPADEVPLDAQDRSKGTRTGRPVMAAAAPA